MSLSSPSPTAYSQSKLLQETPILEEKISTTISSNISKRNLKRKPVWISLVMPVLNVVFVLPVNVPSERYPVSHKQKLKSTLFTRVKISLRPSREPDSRLSMIRSFNRLLPLWKVFSRTQRLIRIRLMILSWWVGRREFQRFRNLCRMFSVDAL